MKAKNKDYNSRVLFAYFNSIFIQRQLWRHKIGYLPHGRLGYKIIIVENVKLFTFVFCLTSSRLSGLQGHFILIQKFAQIFFIWFYLPWTRFKKEDHPLRVSSFDDVFYALFVLRNLINSKPYKIDGSGGIEIVRILDWY